MTDRQAPHDTREEILATQRVLILKWDENDMENPVVTDECDLCETQYDEGQDIYAWGDTLAGRKHFVLKAFCSRGCVDSAILNASDESGVVPVTFHDAR